VDEDETYEVQLRGNTDDYQKSMSGAIGTTDALTASLGKLAIGLANVYSTTTKRLTLFSAGEVATITALTASAGRLEQQMAHLTARQTMTNQSTRGYNATVNNLRRDLGGTSDEVIGLVTNLTRMNVPLSQQQSVLKNYAGLAAVTGESITGLSAGITQFMRSVSSTSSFQAADKYSSMIASLTNNFGAGAQSTLDFANSIAPLSKTMGMNAQQIAGISAAFSKAGQDGYTAANVYTKILTDVNRAVTYGGPELLTYSNLLGKTVSQFKAMPAADVISGIFTTLQKEGPQAIRTLDQIGLDGVRSQRAIAAIMQQGGFVQAIGTANQGFSPAGVQKFQQGTQQALKGVDQQMASATQTVKVFGQTIGGVFLPVADKMSHALNMALSPLQEASNLLSGDGPMNTGVRALVLGLSGLAVTLPLLPRLFTALGTAALGASALRGPFTQGLRLGFRPDRELSRTQQSFIGGEGRVGGRGLFRSGMLLGDVMNSYLPGNRGNLGQHQFMEPTGINTGPNRPIRQILGMNEENRNRLMSAFAGGPVNSTSRLARPVAFMGEMARAQLFSLTPAALRNPLTAANPNAMSQASRIRDMQPFLGFRQFFSQQGVDSSLQATRENTVALRQAHTAFREGTGVWREVGKQLALTTGYGLKATAGLAGGAAVGTARLGSRLAGGALSMVGGPAGLAIMGGLGVGSALYNDIQARKEMITGNDVDSAAGAAYRDSLGLAARATTTFADVVKANSARVSTSVDTMGQALKVSTQDIVDATGKSFQIVDQNLKKLNLSQAGAYASQVVGGSTNPQEVQLLKYDLIARFGAPVAQQILKNSTGGSNANLFGMFNNRDQQFLGGSITNRLYTSQGTRNTQDVVADTIKSQIAGAQAQGGPASAARASQSYLNQFFQSVEQRGRSGGAITGGLGPSDTQQSAFILRAMGGMSSDKITQAGATAILQSMGVNASDTKSLDGMQAILSDSKGRSFGSDQEFQNWLQDEYKKHLTGTELGNQVTGAQSIGGVYTGTSYSVGSLPPPSTDIIFGGAQTIQALRGQRPGGRNIPGSFYGAPETVGVVNPAAAPNPYLVGQVETNTGPGGSGLAVGGALQHTESATAQVVATSQTIIAALANAKGNIDGVSHSMYDLMNTSGDSNSDLYKFNANLQASVESLRAFQNVISGHTTTNFSLSQAQGDLSAAMGAFRRNPNAPNAATQVETQKTNAQQLLAQATQREVGLAMQYRQFNIQQRQGVQQVQRQQGVAATNFTRQRQYGEADFQLQRNRGEEDYARERSRTLSDYDLQRSRSEDDYNRQRARGIADYDVQQRRQLDSFNLSRHREEEDYNHQVQVMAKETAQTVYDQYQRITVQRTFSGTNLLQNLGEQQKALDTQEKNLAKARKMGLSNLAIQQLGLNTSANAQQLTRLVQDMTEDPRMVAQFNASAKKRLGTATKLMEDPANAQFTEMTRSRKLNLSRQTQDFDIATNQQREDFNKSLRRSATDFALQTGRSQDDFNRQLSRSRSDFGLQMDRSLADFNKMETRQIAEMKIGFAQQWSDFYTQMEISKENIGLYAEELGLSFVDAWKIVDTNTTGEMNRQNSKLHTLFMTLLKTAQTDVPKLYAAIDAPFNALTKYKPFGGKPVLPGGFSALPGEGRRQAGGVPVGGPADVGDVQRAASLGIVEGSHTMTQARSGGHPGIDIAGAEGKGVRAMQPGVVTYAGPAGPYGNLIKLAHGGGAESWYGHLSHLGTRTGELVSGGAQIGRVGHTGRTSPEGSAGSHLHLEVRVNGRDTDPSSLLGLHHGIGAQGGPPAGYPDFAKMPAVKNWNSFLDKTGANRFIGGDSVIVNLALEAYGKALKATGGLSSYSGHVAPGKFGGSKVSSEQIANARIIAQVGAAMGVPSSGIVIALMTALQESGLHNLSYGNRDSLGLFQQRSGWGSKSQRTDPRQAAAMFFQGGHGGQRGLEDIPGWEQMSKGQAAQAVQVSAFPGAYSQWQNEAISLLRALASAVGVDATPGTGSSKHTTWKGGHFTERFVNTLKHAEHLLGQSMQVFQGGFSHSVAASGTSHYGDAVDAGPAGNSTIAHSVQNALRHSGVAAWVRGPYADTAAGRRFSMSHVHGVPLPGYGWAGGSGIWQGQDYLKGGDGLFTGTPSASPGWKMVGEHGYEFIKLKGGEEVRNHAQSQTMVRGAQTVIPQPTTVNNHYDSSTSWAGAEITVYAQDVNDFSRQLQAKQRLAALTSRPK
jgi:murein DD-endopeptidase MepM/ murein hydrolase activator NlpD